jgi:putative oxidoreductase
VTTKDVFRIRAENAALGAAALLAIGVYSLQVVKGLGWNCNNGGYEYPVFWAITLAVALEAWKPNLRRARSALATKAMKVAA